MSTSWIGVEIDSIESDAENISVFVEEGTPVLLLDDEEMAEIIGIDLNMSDF